MPSRACIVFKNTFYELAHYFRANQISQPKQFHPVQRNGEEFDQLHGRYNYLASICSRLVMQEHLNHGSRAEAV